MLKGFHTRIEVALTNPSDWKKRWPNHVEPVPSWLRPPARPGRLHAPCQSAGRPSECRKGALGAADTALETDRFSLCTYDMRMPWRIVRCPSIAAATFIQKKLKIHRENTMDSGLVIPDPRPMTASVTWVHERAVEI